MFKDPDFYGYFAVTMMVAILVFSVLGALADKKTGKEDGKGVDTDKL